MLGDIGVCLQFADFLERYMGDSLVLMRYGFFCISVGYIERNNKPINPGWHGIFPEDEWEYETIMLLQGFLSPTFN